MRHLIGIALAIIMAVMIFLAAAWGCQWLLRTISLSMVPAGGGSLIPDHRTMAALIAVAGTGLLAGILVAAPRILPLAAGLPGLLLLGWTALYVVSTRHAIDLIPLRAHVYGAGLEEMLRSGVLGAAGLAMIIPLLVPSRWWARRTPMPEAAEASEFLSGLTQGTGPQAPAEPASYPQQEDEACQPRPAGSPPSLHHPG